MADFQNSPISRIFVIFSSGFLSQNNSIILVKEVLYEVRCLKSTEDMILALAGQFKQFR